MFERRAKAFGVLLLVLGACQRKITTARTSDATSTTGSVDATAPLTNAAPRSDAARAVIRLISPQPGSVMSSRAVIFAWEGGPAQVELSGDRKFAQVAYRAAGDGTAQISGIDDGHWFWRVVASGATSDAWRIRRIGSGATALRQGVLYGADFDGNGANDLVFRQAVLLGGQRLSDNYRQVQRLTSEPAVACHQHAEDDSHQGRCDNLGRGVPIGDVNGDGFDDLMADVNDGGTLLWLGTSSVSDPWRPHQHFCPTRDPCKGGGKIVRLGDVNGDGFADVALSTSSPPDDSIAIFYGDEAGISSTPAVVLPKYFECTGGGDVDGDGLHDLVALDAKGNLLLFLGHREGVNKQPDETLSLGLGAFTDRGDRSSQPHITMVDLDGDGLSDIVVAHVLETGAPRLAAIMGKSKAPHLARTPTLVWPHPDCCHPIFAWTQLPRTPSSASGILVLERSGEMLGTAVVSFVPGAGLGPPLMKRRIKDMAIYSDTVESVGDVNADGFDDWLGVHGTDIDGSPVDRLFLGSKSGGWGDGPAYTWVEGMYNVIPSGERGVP